MRATAVVTACAPPPAPQDALPANLASSSNLLSPHVSFLFVVVTGLVPFEISMLSELLHETAAEMRQLLFSAGVTTWDEFQLEQPIHNAEHELT